MFNLRSRKIKYSVIFLFLLFTKVSMAQDFTQLNLPHSDERWLHYGFSIGIHSTAFKLNYSEEFTSAAMDSVQSIMPMNKFGFSLGFITDFRLHDQFNLRILPRVSFSEYHTEIAYTSDSLQTTVENIEATFVEVPILIKYKSERHKNFRMYVVGGIVPAIEASGKKRKERSGSRLKVGEANLSAEVGFGLDMYYPLFKFSPEIRYSRGLINVLKEDDMGYHRSIDRLSTHSISLFLQFSD